MIKINLLPVKEKKRRKEFMVGFVIVVVLILISLGMSWIYLQRVRMRSNLKNEISQIKEESKTYEDKINEIKELEAKEASLDGFKKTIKNIAEIQRKVIVAVDQLALLMPSGVWLTNLTQGKGADGNKFIVDGYAYSMIDLNNYFNSIQRPGAYLKDATIDLKNASVPYGNNKQIQQFQITAKVMDQGS